jgi:hypothetical protein
MSNTNVILYSSIMTLQLGQAAYVDYLYSNRTIDTEISRLVGFALAILLISRVDGYMTSVLSKVPTKDMASKIENDNNTCEVDKRADNYVALSPDIIKYIKDEGLEILEVCAGKGANMRILKEKEVDIVSFDMNSGEDISYGICGTFEEKYPTRTLLACCGFDMEKSISRFSGNKVILGGYLTRSSYQSSVSEYIKDFVSSDQVTSMEGTELTIVLRPSYKWMMDNGWEYERAYYRGWGDCKSMYHCFYVFNRKNIDEKKDEEKHDSFDILDKILDEVFEDGDLVCETKDELNELTNSRVTSSKEEEEYDSPKKVTSFYETSSESSSDSVENIDIYYEFSG